MFKIEYLKAGVKLRTRSGLPVEVIKTGARIGPEFDSEGNIIKLYDIVVLINPVMKIQPLSMILLIGIVQAISFLHMMVRVES